MGDDDLDGLSDAEAFDHVAMMIDQASITLNAELTDQGLAFIEKLAKRPSLQAEQQLLLYYFRANAFANKLVEAGIKQTWAWEIPHLETVIHELRRAVRHDAFPTLAPFRQCQILTNLGSKLNSVGRPVEALVQWDRAISINPLFAMALANRGRGLGSYAGALYDDRHAGVLLSSAHSSLVAAGGKDAQYDALENYAHRGQFEAMAAQIAERIDLDVARTELLRDVRLGRSRAERAYRVWALDNRLFLNPLNDLGSYNIAARDVLHLPSLTMGPESGGPEPPIAFGFYNQLKQEFVSARLLCFEGLSEHRAHFSDNDTHLYDTLNIPAYSLAVEKTKAAFRIAYSLLDKIAFFINDYFRVGLSEKSVSFRNVWYQRSGNSKLLSPAFKDRHNWPLRGLYWLSKDIYEPAFQVVSEPEAEGLAELRNHLEHKYCQVHEDLGVGYSRFATAQNGIKLGHRIGRDTLEAKTLHMLQKARSALIYLSLSVHREEAARSEERGAERVVERPLRMWKERRRL